MGIALELLMARDEDIATLVRKPKQTRAVIDKNWSGAESEKDHQARRSMSIWRTFGELDYVLRAGRPQGELPLGFLGADGHVLGKVKRTRRIHVGDKVVEYPEYENEKDFYNGPPSAFLSNQVAEVNHALGQVDDDWIKRAYNPDDLIAPITLEAPAFDLDQHVREHVQACQEITCELKAFIARAARDEMGLIRFHW